MENFVLKVQSCYSKSNTCFSMMKEMPSLKKNTKKKVLLKSKTKVHTK